MRQKSIVCTAWLVAGLAAAAWGAATEAQFQTWMKGAGAACGRAKKGIDAKKTGPELAADAQEMSKNFKAMEKFWKDRKAADAAELAATARKESDLLAKAAKANKVEDAQAHFKGVTGTCKKCHDAHRTKGGDGKFSIK